ncbi:hypothetical protein Taro_031507 [Colocasia esculenta]|uniref:Pentatricopeptide repeat-containing protein n=1 Tax=Colocasia esculenta TaxID=4460 RepID=A0A843VWV6_COLES|nr:hypothetical protein [Colocasia esculenta]
MINFAPCPRPQARLGRRSACRHRSYLHVWRLLCDARSARRVFEKGSHESSISLWNALISGFVNSGNACADIGALDVVKWMHEYSSRFGIRLNVYVATSLVNMYAKCGCMDMAKKLFDEMPKRGMPRCGRQ